MNLQVGNLAPNFKLPDQTGQFHELSDYRGQWVLVYFYPKDDTPGCTKEACEIRDAWSEFSKNNIKVFGISVDDVTSHKKFSSKYKLPFTILADDQKNAVKLYGVWVTKKFLGKTFAGTKRSSFLIDPDGVIVKIYEKVKPAVHATEVLNDWSILNK